jgi:hypothetical protein
MPVTSYSRTPASNNSAAPNGAPEGWAPSAVNDTVRQIMTDIATVTGVLSPTLDAYTAGMIVIFTPAVTNTGATTLNIDSLGALDIQKFNGLALSAGDLVAGTPALLVLDSGADDWILVNPQYRGLGFRSITGADSTAASDNGFGVVCGGAGSYTFTIDSDFAATGNIMTLINDSSGDITIAESLAGNLFWMNGSGTIGTGSRTLAIGGVATIMMASANSPYVWGVGLS